MAKPFLRWAGGKRRVLAALDKHIPRRIENYFEPFLGGGAVFWHLQERGLIQGTARLSDLNKDLIEAYFMVRTAPAVVRLILQTMKGAAPGKEGYYRVRAHKWDDPAIDATRFIYLNQTCFNGLYRVNKVGEFNVPYGEREINIEALALRSCSMAMERTSLDACSYESALADAKCGDFVYLDPPYLGAFTGYTAKQFSLADHIQLRTACDVLTGRGVRWVLSNSDTRVTRKIFTEYDMYPLDVARSVGASAKTRVRAGELLITNKGQI